jgi:hypothetical protein
VKTMIHRVIPSLLLNVVMHESSPPSDEEWGALVATVREFAPTRRLRAITFTDGAAPTSKQRAAAADALAGYPMPIAVVTDSMLARGAVTAFRWLGNPEIRAFGADQLNAALDYLGVEFEQRPLVYSAQFELREELVASAWGRMAVG